MSYGIEHGISIFGRTLSEVEGRSFRKVVIYAMLLSALELNN